MAAESASAAPLERSRYLLIEPPKERWEGEAIMRSAIFKATHVEPDSELGKFLQSSSIAKWKTFEDEHVRFDYPDFVDFKVLAAGDEPAPGTAIYGGPIGTVNRQSN